MSGEQKNAPQGEFILRILEAQTKYGIDQETMLIYLNSVNLMAILGLLQNKLRGGAGITLPGPFNETEGASPSAGAAASGGGPSLENLAGMLSGLMGQGGGKGLNPAALASLYNLYNALGGPNMDMNAMLKTLGSMLGKGDKTSPEARGKVSPAPAEPDPGKGKEGETAGQGTREVPKIMKWDRFDDRRRA
ncbi:MAG: hypothetical protein K6T80_01990 [Firmicutes bacterium]|nr:hypothetical protein [Bacillota bacterium]